MRGEGYPLGVMGKGYPLGVRGEGYPLGVGGTPRGEGYPLGVRGPMDCCITQTLTVLKHLKSEGCPCDIEG